jgi:hypothetical protein
VDSVCTFLLDRVPGPAEPGPGVAVTAGHNVFDQGAVVLQVEQTGEWGLPSAEVQARLPRVLAWRENENVYSSGAGFAAWGLNDPSAGGLKTSGEWFRFWKANAGHTTLGRIRYQGGGLRGKAASAPESLAPADFRVLSIREGADVDLVGPGTAYARWKRTPAYRQWLKDARPPAK